MDVGGMWAGAMEVSPPTITALQPLPPNKKIKSKDPNLKNTNTLNLQPWTAQQTKQTRYARLDQSLFARLVRLGVETVQLDKQVRGACVALMFGFTHTSFCFAFVWRGGPPVELFRSWARKPPAKQPPDPLPPQKN